MTVKFIYRHQEYDIPIGMTVRDAIKKIGLQPETILAVVDGKLITDDTIIKEEMKTIKLVAVISGGSAPTLALPRSNATGEGGEAGRAL
jgi:sulfur carrier protein ThiS